MVGPPQPFRRPASVMLDVHGYGFCYVTCPNGLQWTIETTSVSTNVPKLLLGIQPLVVVYHDSAPNDSAIVESTIAGNRDASNTVHRLLGGESLCAEWTGGVPGCVATLRVSGIAQEV